MGQVISIAERKIGADFPPYVIAEMSANHNGSLEIAIQTIKAAKRAGADCIKFQIHDLENEMLKQTPQSDNFKESFKN